MGCRGFGPCSPFNFCATFLCMRRSSKPLPKDANQLAYEVVRMSTDDTEPVKPNRAVSAYLAQIGKKGGLKGGNARAHALNPERRKAIAEKAAKARWSRKS